MAQHVAARTSFNVKPARQSRPRHGASQPASHTPLPPSYGGDKPAVLPAYTFASITTRLCSPLRSISNRTFRAINTGMRLLAGPACIRTMPARSRFFSVRDR
jgi:hypothetical protein